MNQSPEVKNIVHDLQHLDPNSMSSDNSHLVFEIGQLQRQDGPALWARDSQQINQSINMKALGFNENFSIVGVDQKGQLITRSEDGSKLQTRDPVHLEITGSNSSSGECKKWDNREFDVNSDGSAKYTVKPGDNYYSVVRDALSANLGHPATATDIMNTLDQMKQAYGLKHMSMIHPGDTINIPMPKPKGDGGYSPVAPGLDPSKATGDTALTTQDAGKPANTNYNYDHETGFTTTESKGRVNDNSFGAVGRFFGQEGTSYDTTETTDRQGNLVNRHTSYGGDGTTLSITDQNGDTRQIANVTSVNTKHNNFTGNYETVVTTKDGKSYSVVNANDGAIRTVDPKAQVAYSPSTAYEFGGY